jgi:hypothetical protein
MKEAVIKEPSHPERSRGIPGHVVRRKTGFLDFATLRSE